jgi:hypothetical protein
LPLILGYIFGLVGMILGIVGNRQTKAGGKKVEDLPLLE